MGQRPDLDDIRLAKHGRIDAIIKDVAMHESATLITVTDYVQALVAEAQGIEAMHIRTPTKTTDLEFEKYFDETTMSVHLKERTFPMAKRESRVTFNCQNKPRKEHISSMSNIIKEVSEASRVTGAGSVEISRSKATVLQFGNFRIAITRPPFSDGLEVTIVRPIIRLELEDYNASNKLMERTPARRRG